MARSNAVGVVGVAVVEDLVHAVDEVLVPQQQRVTLQQGPIPKSDRRLDLAQEEARLLADLEERWRPLKIDSKPRSRNLRAAWKIWWWQQRRNPCC